MVEEKRNENGVFDVLNGQRGKNYKTRNASLCQRGFIKKKKKNNYCTKHKYVDTLF